MNIPLSMRLREGTKESHRLAEQSPFIRRLFEGRLAIEAYREFLVQLFYVYQTLEESQEKHHAHAVFGKIYFPVLFRREALLQDLDFYFGGHCWEESPPSPATLAYVQRIQSLSAEWIEGLVAHHYTRYLGDLSGGQALKRVVAKMYHLTSNEGLAFYNFPHIENISRFKDEYRLALDEMPVGDPGVQSIVAEANLAFHLNREVFDSMIELVKLS